MWWTIAGLTLDAVGVFGIGFVLTGHVRLAAVEDGEAVYPATPGWQVFAYTGWAFIVLGFVLQIVGQFC
jgi:hypothetical protein